MAKGESRKNARAPKRSGSSPKQAALEQFRVSADGEHLTTDQGLRINDDQNSLKAGDRGPSLLEDFILREKITHFDHERIPERVVHARGAGAHGYFQVYQSLSRYTKAKFLQDPALRTPVLVASDSEGLARDSAWSPGRDDLTPPALLPSALPPAVARAGSPPPSRSERRRASGATTSRGCGTLPC